MKLELENKVVLVTGSTKGIGFEIAKSFYNEGCRVVLNSRNSEELSACVKEFGERGFGAVGDVTKVKDCEQIVSDSIKKWDNIDILICNVGSGKSVPSGTEDLAEIQRVFDVNFTSTFNTIKAAEKYLEASKGSVVCISSICGMEYLGAPTTYSMSKGALNIWVKGLARPFGKKGIRINAVAPGNVIFPGSVWEEKLRNNEAEVKSMLAKEVALNRLGTPQEISNLVTFLASPKASFITGSVVVSDGGQLRS